MKISGYTTVRNAESMNYPYKETIRSLAQFCDQIVVVNSTNLEDGTTKELEALTAEIPQLEVVEADVDWSAPNHGIFDGQTKALARTFCDGDWLYQIDCDEIVHELDAPKIRDWISMFEKTAGSAHVDVISLPVIEYWGKDKVRMDINPWKPRLSRNNPRITHGIPSFLRKIEDGLLYAKHGTDGCDYIYGDTGEPVQFVSTYNSSMEEMRRKGLTGDEQARSAFEGMFNDWVNSTPGVFHYSWYSVYEKIKKYKLFWNDSWKSLYNENRDPNWNPFFEKNWEDVTDIDMKLMGLTLEGATGGWIFHNKWDGSTRPHIHLDREHPAIMTDWRKKVALLSPASTGK